MSLSSNNLDELKNVNRILKRNIKWCKVLIAKQEEVLQKKIKQEREKAAGKDLSEIDDNSTVPMDIQSFASYSQNPAGPTYQVDINRVEKINMNVALILSSKSPFECLQQVLKTFKEAFKNVSRLTIFVINRYLQSYVFKD